MRWGGLAVWAQMAWCVLAKKKGGTEVASIPPVAAGVKRASVQKPMEEPSEP